MLNLDINKEIKRGLITNQCERLSNVKTQKDLSCWTSEEDSLKHQCVCVCHISHTHNYCKDTLNQRPAHTHSCSFCNKYFSGNNIGSICFFIRWTVFTLFDITGKSRFLSPHSLSVLKLLHPNPKLSENDIPIRCETSLEDIHICLKVALMLNLIKELFSYWVYHFQSVDTVCAYWYKRTGPLFQSCVLGFFVLPWFLVLLPL